MKRDDFTPQEIRRALGTIEDVMEIHCGGYIEDNADYRLARRFINASIIDIEELMRGDQACARTREKENMEVKE